MTAKRLLGIVLVLAVVAVAIFLLLDERTVSRTDRPGSESGGAGGAGEAPEGAPVAGPGALAGPEEIRALIAKYGGFRARGRLLLTGPAAPGRGLSVRLRGSLEGRLFEAGGLSGEDGGFLLDELPRATGLLLAVEGERVQGLRKEGLEPPPGPDFDLGDLLVDRWYFVSGRVVGPQNRPVGSASVALILAAGGGNSFSFLKLAQETGVEDPALAEVETGPDGRFALRLGKPGIFSLRVKAGGYATRYRSDLVVGAGRDAEVTIPLTEGAPVVGYVLDGAGRGVSEAAVAVFTIDFRDFSFPKEVTLTDGSGRFEFRLEPAPREYWLSVVPREGANLSRRFRVPLAEDLMLRLPASGVLAGRVVVAETQQPVEGAEVLIGLAEQKGFGQVPDFSKPLRTDASGRFRIEGVGASFVQSVAVRAEGFADFQANAFQPTDRQLSTVILATQVAAEGETELPPIPLQRGVNLRGVVTDARSGAPIAGASVSLEDFITGSRATTTDATGAYLLPAVQSRVVMAVRAPGYADFRDNPFAGAALSAGSGPGAGPGEAIRDFALEPGTAVLGTVRDAEGKPVEGALVRLRSAATGAAAFQQAASLRELWDYADREGRFRIRGVPPARIFAEAEAPGYDLGRSAERDVRPGEAATGFDILLLRAARMEGHVLRRDGAPVPGARITVARDPGDSNDPGAEWRALGQGVYGFSDERGAFAVEGMPVGNILVRVEAEGFATLTVRKQGVPAGAKFAGEMLELAPAFTITGRVVDAAGRPVTTVWVRALHTASPDGVVSKQLLGARVEADGTFLLVNLPEGTYTLEVRQGGPPGAATAYENLLRENVPAGSRDVLLALRPRAE
jgi:protocatechuate 3,4-dioxygenase beta subunit